MSVFGIEGFSAATSCPNLRMLDLEKLAQRGKMMFLILSNHKKLDKISKFQKAEIKIGHLSHAAFIY